LEYWDIERKRYPQYDHIAVLVAEDITSRFLNIISLFNGFVPLIALKMTAFRVGDQIVLTFIKVLDRITLGIEETPTIEPPADREYWIKKASEEMVSIVEARDGVDDCRSILKTISPTLSLKYNRYYIGITESGLANNFIVFRPKKAFVRVEVRISPPDQLDSWDGRLNDAGIVVLPGGRADGWIRFRLTKQDLEQHRDLITELFTTSYKTQQE
jgi:hypothetical protein